MSSGLETLLFSVATWVAGVVMISCCSRERVGAEGTHTNRIVYAGVGAEGSHQRGQGQRRNGQGQGEAEWGEGSAKAAGRLGEARAKGRYGHPKPAPPVGEPGEWVLREVFDGKKSFGVFFCPCGRTWTTAHAWKDYKQGCQSCDVETFAFYMWKNDRKGKSYSRKQDNFEDDRPPHDRARCEACRRGVCML
mmetsp:Transcript_8427/g.24119  ORF Transcript_8427/g.24119 Transcript_8427/m.24119 type:complete len:192 (+) Transcript_8427:64-639(+)